MPIANARGQVNLTAHITAEVIESVHASSTVVTGFSLKNQQSPSDSIKKIKGSWSSEKLDLGAVTINAGDMMACNIQLNEATLTDNKGNCFTIEPTTHTSGNTNTLRADGTQTISLNGTPHLTKGLVAGRYTGSYLLVVVYN